MWVEELPSGKFRYAERFLDPRTGKMKKVSVTLEKNSKQAYRQAINILSKKINDKGTNNETKLTIADVVELYREDQKKSCQSFNMEKKLFCM